MRKFLKMSYTVVLFVRNYGTSLYNKMDKINNDCQINNK